MKTRVKLLLAGAVLVVAMWRPAPAEAWCSVQSMFGFDSEEACEQYCYGGGCYSYFFDGGACFCS
jgi:hypothetical protein